MEPEVIASPTNPDFPTKLPENLPPSRKGSVFFIISVVFFGLLVTGAAAAYWFVLRDKVKPVVCTMEAKICPDGSSVGRTGLNCEFAPCPLPLPTIPVATPSSNLQIPELGIQLTLPDELLDLKYHIENYEHSTAALFTTESLAGTFPKCEFPIGGLGWITRVKEATAIHNKKIGDYYFGIEQAKENCSRTPGSDTPNPIEASQEELFMKLFETIEAL